MLFTILSPALVAQTPVAATRKPALENLHKLTDQLLSRGEPHGDAAFSKLAELGVRTIVSVDGARPDLKAAKKHGIRYVHIPIGYDGVDEPAQASLTRIGREAWASLDLANGFFLLAASL